MAGELVNELMVVAAVAEIGKDVGLSAAAVLDDVVELVGAVIVEATLWLTAMSAEVLAGLGILAEAGATVAAVAVAVATSVATGVTPASAGVRQFAPAGYEFQATQFASPP